MPANYVLLERIELNASAASVTFSNIPQSGYTDLKIVVSARSSYSSGEGILMQFNGSSGANYFYRQLYGGGSSAGSYTPGSGQTSCLVGTMGGTNFTASTFDSVEIYIPNYTSSTNKSFSVDSVAENNSATVNQLDLIAGLWSQTAAITSINLFSYNAANFVQYSTFSLYGLAALGTTPVIAPKASGGNITTDGTYWIHTFLTSGTFTPATSLSCDYLVVAGGGGGGLLATTLNGGGGAGGFRTGTSLAVTATPYTITVGAGGAINAIGGDSTFSTITSTGGGLGGVSTGVGGDNPGGSGGGGGEDRAGGAGNTPSTSPSQGNNGGAGKSSGNGGGGGGGGAGAVGTTVIAGSQQGNGGNGTANSYSGSSVTYAGGGGGAVDSLTQATGGTGGGGAGAKYSSSVNATAGTTNLGGGGGGGLSSGRGNAAAGGSGVVIIRYLA